MDKMIGFICPLSEPGSEIRKRSDTVEACIKSVASRWAYEVVRPDRKKKDKPMKDIVAMIRDADILIVDLTELNANVLYELGMRHAIKGKCIYIKSDDKPLPFDLADCRAYEYTLEGAAVIDLQNHIEESIKELQKEPWLPSVLLSPEHLIELYDATLVQRFLSGTKSYYSLAKDFFEKPCRNIFIMQRSSSLVLNAEQGKREEGLFIEIVKQAIENMPLNGEFYHIVSMDGMKEHLGRTSSAFPEFEDYARNIACSGGNVVISRKSGSAPQKDFYIRKSPKSDQHTRMIITETTDGVVKAGILQSLGTNPACFMLQGSKAREYLTACIDYYGTCDFLKWQEIVDLYNDYTGGNEESP